MPPDPSPKSVEYISGKIKEIVKEKKKETQSLPPKNYYETYNTPI